MLSISVRHVCGVLVAALVVSGCSSGEIVSNQTFSAVVTLVDSGPALRSARTFVLPDTVVLFPRFGTPITGFAAAEIIAAIRTHFIALGWTEVRLASALRPDVVVLVAESTQIRTSVFFSDWFAAWGFLPFWGSTVDATWVWVSSASPVEFTFQAGTLFVTMIDVRAPNITTRRLHVLWAAGLDGVISDPSTAAVALVGINQAFAQSPFLRLK